jgi:predicted PurR-regulated permease PerM
VIPSWISNPKLRYRALLITALIILLLVVVIPAWTALVPFFLGLFVAYLFMPLVDFLDRHSPRFLRRHGWSRALVILLLYLVVIAILAAILMSFIPLLTQQAVQLIDMATTYVPDLLEELMAIDIDVYLERIPVNIREGIDANIRQAGQTIGTAIQRTLTVTLRTLSQTVSFVIGMVIIPFWLFYVLRDKVEARRNFYSLMPEVVRDDVRAILRLIDELLSSYIRGQLFMMLIVGAMATVALLIIGVDLAIVLGTFAGLFEVIPILGPYIGALPAVFIALLDQPIKAVWVILAFAVIQQVESIVLRPLVAGHAVRFHPAVIMVIIVVGAEVAGIWGMLLGVPAAAIVRDVYQYLYLRTTERGATPEMAIETLHARIL